MTFQLFSKTSPSYMNDIFKAAGQHSVITKKSLLKLSQPLRETNHAQNNLSYIAHTFNKHFFAE